MLLLPAVALGALTASTPPRAPSRGLSPSNVVEAQLAALAQNDCRTCFGFASPQNRRVTGPWKRFEQMVREAPAYSPLLACSSFEILSALSTAPDVWRCRVRVRPAGSSSAPFAIASPFVEYRWELSRQADSELQFELGQCLRHKRYSYRGVVVGFDRVCSQSEEWIAAMSVDALPHGRSQPFYQVLVDERDRPGGQVTYVAQENILLADTPAEPLLHPGVFGAFDEFDAAGGRYVPRPELLEQYPRDVGGCWMVDAVIPDQPAVAG